MMRILFYILLIIPLFLSGQSDLEKEVYELQRLYPANPGVVLDSLERRVERKFLEGDTVEGARTISAISFLLYSTLNNPEGAIKYRDKLDSLRRALELEELDILLIELDAKIAMLGDDPQRGLDYFLEALSVSKRVGYRYYQLLAETAGMFAEFERYDTAKAYFRLAESQLLREEREEELALLYHNWAVTYFFESKIDSSLFYFDKSIHYARKSGNNIDYVKNTYAYGTACVKKHELTSDKRYLDTAQTLYNEVLDSMHLLYSYKIKSDVYNNARVIEERLGNFEKALKYSKLQTRYVDSMSIADIEAGKLKSDFQRVKLLLEREKIESEQERAESKRKRDRYILVSVFVLVLVAGIAVMLVMKSRYKARYRKLETEKLKKEKVLNDQVLTTKSMAVLAKDKVVLAALEKLNTYFQSREEVDPILKELRAELKISLSNETWEEIEETFNRAHPEFIKKLYNLHSDLTKNERRLCVLIYMNLSSREIGQLTGQSISTINVARSRLRKKFGLTDQSVSVYSHLQYLISGK